MIKNWGKWKKADYRELVREWSNCNIVSQFLHCCVVVRFPFPGKFFIRGNLGMSACVPAWIDAVGLYMWY